PTVQSCRQPIRLSAANTRRAFAEGHWLMPQCRKHRPPNRSVVHREQSDREVSLVRPTELVGWPLVLVHRTGGRSTQVLRQSNAWTSRSSSIVSFITTP